MASAPVEARVSLRDEAIHCAITVRSREDLALHLEIALISLRLRADHGVAGLTSSSFVSSARGTYRHESELVSAASGMYRH